VTDPNPDPPDTPNPLPAGTTPAPATPPHPWYIRAFRLTPGQALRLVGLSTLAGFFILAFDFSPAGATFDVGGAVTAIIHRALTALGWALESFWKPALAGLAVVVPLWALWRLATLPFRK
jgi:hypothetical protein